MPEGVFKLTVYDGGKRPQGNQEGRHWFRFLFAKKSEIAELGGPTPWVANMAAKAEDSTDADWHVLN